MKKIYLLLLIFWGSSFFASQVRAEVEVRVKDIAKVSGFNSLPLYGYGLVIGLAGTGDKKESAFTMQAVANMLERLGITVPKEEIMSKNVAAVIVTGELPPYSKQGTHIDVTVSSLGDARSLQGGTLLPTLLLETSGESVAEASGSISIGGYSAKGGLGGVQKNHPTVGRIPNGGVVQREIPTPLPSETLELLLDEPDFTTASRVAEEINANFSKDTAKADSAATIKVKIPDGEKDDVIRFLSKLENLNITPDKIAVVVVDERTGALVIGQEVKISSVAVSLSGLSVEIRTDIAVSQSPPLANGETVVVPEEEVSVKEGEGQLKVVPSLVSVEEIAKALNAIGATPRELIEILQAIKKAGALHAKLVIM